MKLENIVMIFSQNPVVKTDRSSCLIYDQVENTYARNLYLDLSNIGIFSSYDMIIGVDEI